MWNKATDYIRILIQKPHWLTNITGHYNPSVGITAWFLMPLMLCSLILYVSGETYSLTSTPNYSFFFEKLFHGSFYLFQTFCQKSVERKSLKNYIFSYFVLMPDLYTNPELTLTSLVLCSLILYVSGETYSLTSTPNYRFFWKTFSWQFLFTLRLFARNLLSGNR